jgi:hypothetical protein
MVIRIVLGVSGLVGWLGDALFMGPAFLDSRRSHGSRGPLTLKLGSQAYPPCANEQGGSA